MGHVAHGRRAGHEDPVVRNRGPELVHHQGLGPDRAELLVDIGPHDARLGGAIRVGVAALLELGEQQIERGRGVSYHCDRVVEVASDLRGVDVDVHDHRVGRDLAPEEMRAHREDHVGVVEHRLQAPVHPDRTDGERMTIVDRALSLSRGDDARLEELGHRGELCARVAEHHSPAGPDQRSFRPGEHRGRPLDVGGVGGEAHVVGPIEQRDVGFLGERLRRHLDLHRLATAALHSGERFVHGLGDLPRGQRPALPRCDRAHEVELVVDLVQQAEALADPVAVDLTGDEHHR